MGGPCPTFGTRIVSAKAIEIARATATPRTQPISMTMLPGRARFVSSRTSTATIGSGLAATPSASNAICRNQPTKDPPPPQQTDARHLVETWRASDSTFYRAKWCSLYASAFALMLSNSACVMAPFASRSCALAMSSAAEPPAMRAC